MKYFLYGILAITALFILWPFAATVFKAVCFLGLCYIGYKLIPWVWEKAGR